MTELSLVPLVPSGVWVESWTQNGFQLPTHILALRFNLLNGFGHREALRCYFCLEFLSSEDS